ncbi:MAG: undecaprenyl/decaprenyl-phosphate alpha-N-acetylglucosaminyl 1-phosphate transferase [Nitrospinota bacterium]|nr:undecaprenyl/decaprenyl-phosphate alpha-N-acetylglucosaminyl 1-phosphate transferase [Nitrospinota bacterium]
MIWFQYLTFFFASFVVSWVISRRLPARFSELGIVDKKSLPRKIPTAGGIAIAVSFILVVAISVFFYPEGIGDTYQRVTGLIVAAMVIALLGLYDDLYHASPAVKLLVQIIAAVILVASGLGMEKLTNPFAHVSTNPGSSVLLGTWGNLLLVGWILLLTNAVNIIDGLDGLASGICLISAMTMFTISHIFGETTLAALSLILVGSIFGFIGQNLPPAKIYLGDTGSLFLGFVLAAISITERRKGSVTVTLLVPVIVAAIPILDIFFSFFRRIFSWKNPFEGDELHTHHRLLSLGLSPEQINRMIYLVSIYLGINAGVLAFFPKETTIIVMILLAIGMLMAIEFIRSIPAKGGGKDKGKNIDKIVGE